MTQECHCELLGPQRLLISSERLNIANIEPRLLTHVRLIYVTLFHTSGWGALTGTSPGVSEIHSSEDYGDASQTAAY